MKLGINSLGKIKRIFYKGRGRESARWRYRVLKRDRKTCQKCGSKKNVVAHHIENWRWYPEKRYDVNNGITLCRDCHKKVHERFGDLIE